MLKTKRDKLLGRNKFLGFLVDRLKNSDVTESFLSGIDASELLAELLRAAKKRKSPFIRSYVGRLVQQGRLRRVFPSPLIDAIEQSSLS